MNLIIYKLPKHKNNLLVLYMEYYNFISVKQAQEYELIDKIMVMEKREVNNESSS